MRRDSICRGRLARQFFLAVFASTQLGCIVGTAKLRVGPTVDTDGNKAIQADVAFGFGYAVSTDSGVTASLGLGTGSRNHFQVTESLEYHRFEDSYGWRSGFHVDAGVVGGYILGGWVHGALLVPIKQDRSRTVGHEKGGFLDSGTGASRWSVGIEGRVGYLAYEDDDDGTETAAGFGAAATLEWHAFSRMQR